jgi:hypothetical protein
MHILDIKRDLVALGIDPQDYRVLKMLPLVYVAWADGKMEHVEHARIMEVALQRFQIGESGARILQHWLAAPPSRLYVERALGNLLGLAMAPDELDVKLEDLPELLLHAEGIARSTADALDAPWAVTPEEEEALAEIARVLCVDSGTSWAALLRELDGVRQSQLTIRVQSAPPQPRSS